MWYTYVKIDGEWRLAFTETSLQRCAVAVTPYYPPECDIVTYEFHDGCPTVTFSLDTHFPRA